LGRTPLTTDWVARPRAASVSTIVRRFGGWDGALRSAGLEPASRPFTRAETIDDLRQCALEHGTVPTTRSWPAWARAHRAACVSKISGEFGSWRAALHAAGLIDDPSPIDPLEALRAFHDRRGHAPTVREWQADGEPPSASTITQRYGSWNQALTRAGLTTRRESHWQRADILAAIRAFTIRHGRPPKRHDWDRTDGSHPAGTTVVNHFGSWAAALRTAATE
jgi:hypothetical protein